MSEFELFFRMLEEHPYCFGLSQPENLETIGVNRVRRISGFDYRGGGMIIGFVDTGIDYRHPEFLTAKGVSRVKTIWDQNGRTGPLTEGEAFGRVYGEEEISAGTAPTDENGHGTFLAGVAAGGTVGVASLAELAVVKLREASPELKAYFCMPEKAVAFSEADIMLGVRYLLRYAKNQGKPLVLCLGVGCGLGSHRGTMPLSLYLNSLVYEPEVCIVTAAGNEGNARHHARVALGSSKRETELYVENRGSGFTLEIFAEVIADVNVKLRSPAGEEIRIPGNGIAGAERFPLLLDRSVLYAERRNLLETERMQRLRLRLERPAAGIWRLVFDRSNTASELDLWLPASDFLEGEVYFPDAVAEVTLCEPANAPLLITVGGCSADNRGTAPFSGRGFTADGLPQPTLLAPAVNVEAPFAGGGYITGSGTSIGVAYTAGVAALFLEYIAEYRKDNQIPPMNTVLLRNLFSMGAVREEGMEYPSPVNGYGILNFYGIFEFLRDL